MPSFLAYRCDWDGSTIVAVHQLGGEAVTVALALNGRTTPTAASTCLGRRARARHGHAELDPHGFRWLRVLARETAAVSRWRSTREHGSADSAEYVLVQGRARIVEDPSPQQRMQVRTQAEA